MAPYKRKNYCCFINILKNIERKNTKFISLVHNFTDMPYSRRLRTCLATYSVIGADPCITIRNQAQVNNINKPIYEEFVKVINYEVCTVRAQGFVVKLHWHRLCFHDAIAIACSRQKHQQNQLDVPKQGLLSITHFQKLIASSNTRRWVVLKCLENASLELGTKL